MSTITVRINKASHQALRKLAKRTGKSMSALLERAIDEYERKAFLEEVNAGFAKLRRDPKAWEQELEERAAWDIALSDGQDR